MAARGALEAMLSITGQQEFAAAIGKVQGSILDLAKTTDTSAKAMAASMDLATKQVMTMTAKMDAAFGAQRVTQLRAYNSELGVMRGHLRGIVGMLGGPGVIGGFGLYEAVKQASQVATNQMQWVTEAGVAPGRVASLGQLSSRQASNGISTAQAGQIVRMVESAYSGKASNGMIQNYFTDSANLSAISGGRISALDAATLLIPALQADKSLGGNTTKAAAIINAMVGSGNMQTQDAFSILKTKAVSQLSGLGIGLSELAPLFAFGADTRSGQQAAQFANILPTAILNIAQGGANKQGRDILKGLFPNQDVAKMLQGPDGVTKTFMELTQRAQAKYGTGEAFVKAMTSMFGGASRGAAIPMAIAGNTALLGQKDVQYNTLVQDNTYQDAAALARKNPNFQWQQTKAQFMDSLTVLGQQALPVLQKVMPPLTEMFKMMGNPNVLHFVELMLAMRGLTMLSAVGGGIAGRGIGGLLTGGAMAKFNPVAGFAKGRAAGLAGRAVVTDVAEIGAGTLGAEALGAGGAALLAPLVVVAAAGAIAVGGVMLMNMLDRNAMKHARPEDNGRRALAKASGVENYVQGDYSYGKLLGNRNIGSTARSQIPAAAWSLTPSVATNGNNVTDDDVIAWARQTMPHDFPAPLPGVAAGLVPGVGSVNDSLRKKYAAAHSETYQGNSVYAPIYINNQTPEQTAKAVADHLKKMRS
jgi:hypothetical protein